MAITFSREAYIGNWYWVESDIRYEEGELPIVPDDGRRVINCYDLSEGPPRSNTPTIVIKSIGTTGEDGFEVLDRWGQKGDRRVMEIARIFRGIGRFATWDRLSDERPELRAEDDIPRYSMDEIRRIYSR